MFGRTDDITRPFSFASVALVVRFLGVADARGEATWTLTNTSAIGVEFHYGLTHLPGGGGISPRAEDVRGFFSLLDLAPPIFTFCPGSTANTTLPGAAVAVATWPAPVASDNRQVAAVNASAVSGQLFAVQQPGSAPHRVVVQARDLFDNAATCVFTVTVTDNEPPTAAPPHVVARVLAPSSSTVTVSSSEWMARNVTDNAAARGVWAQPVLAWHNATATYPYGDHVVGMVYEDAFGNSLSTHTIVSVSDQTPPTLVCPSTIERLAGLGQTGTTVSWSLVTPVDNSGLAVAVSVNATPGSQFAVGEHTVQVVATDVAGLQSTCTFLIRVVAQSVPPPPPPGNASTPAPASSGSTDIAVIAGGGGAGAVLLLLAVVVTVLLVRARNKKYAPQNWEEIFEMMKNLDAKTESFKCVCATEGEKMACVWMGGWVGE